MVKVKLCCLSVWLLVKAEDGEGRLGLWEVSDGAQGLRAAAAFWVCSTWQIPCQVFQVQ